jgi:hypothetical protein
VSARLTHLVMAPPWRTTTPITSVPVGLTRKQPLFMRSGPLSYIPYKRLNDPKDRPKPDLFPCPNPGASLQRRITTHASSRQVTRKHANKTAPQSQAREGIPADLRQVGTQLPKLRGDRAHALDDARSLRPAVPTPASQTLHRLFPAEGTSTRRGLATHAQTPTPTKLYARFPARSLLPALLALCLLRLRFLALRAAGGADLGGLVDLGAVLG